MRLWVALIGAATACAKPVRWRRTPGRACSGSLRLTSPAPDPGARTERPPAPAVGAAKRSIVPTAYELVNTAYWTPAAQRSVTRVCLSLAQGTGIKSA